MKKKKIPAGGTNTDEEQEQKGDTTFMPLIQLITNSLKSKVYFRRLVVRAIEDACFVVFLVASIWLICTFVGGVFSILGVG